MISDSIENTAPAPEAKQANGKRKPTKKTQAAKMAAVAKKNFQ